MLGNDNIVSAFPPPPDPYYYVFVHEEEQFLGQCGKEKQSDNYDGEGVVLFALHN